MNLVYLGKWSLVEKSKKIFGKQTRIEIIRFRLTTIAKNDIMGYIMEEIISWLKSKEGERAKASQGYKKDLISCMAVCEETSISNSPLGQRVSRIWRTPFYLTAAPN